MTKYGYESGTIGISKFHRDILSIDYLTTIIIKIHIFPIYQTLFDTKYCLSSEFYTLPP